MVLLHLKETLELIVKTREFLPGFYFVYDMTDLSC